MLSSANKWGICYASNLWSEDLSFDVNKLSNNVQKGEDTVRFYWGTVVFIGAPMIQFRY